MYITPASDYQHFLGALQGAHKYYGALQGAVGLVMSIQGPPENSLII